MNLLALDTETTRIEPDRVPQLLVLSWADAAGSGVRLAHTPELAAEALAWLRERMADGATELVLHHAAFDLSVLCAAGLARAEVAGWIRAKRVHDTMILDQLLRLAEGGEGSAPGSAYFQKAYDGTLPTRSLATLAREILSRELDKDEALRTGFDSVLQYGALFPRQEAYARADAEATRDIGRVLLARAREYGPELLSEAVQIGGALALAEVSRRGLRLDVEAARAALEQEHAAQRAAGDVLRAAGLLVKERRRERLAEKALREVLGRVAEEGGVAPPRTPTGLVSLSESDWASLADRLSHKVLDAYLEYRRRGKRVAAFLAKWIAAAERGGGRVRAQYRALVASGRTSCHSPNLQQVPRRRGGLTHLFVATEGAALYEIDVDQAELRALAQVCLWKFGQSRLAELLNAGRDVHRLLAAAIYGKPEAEISRAERAVAKMAAFGFPGGMGVRTFIAHAWALGRVRLSEAEAAHIRAAWLATFPEMRDYLASWPGSRIARRAGVRLHERAVERALLGEDTLSASERERLIRGILRNATAFHLDRRWPNGEVVRAKLARGETGRAIADWLRWVAVRTRSGRIRCPVGFTEYLNGGFQGLIADALKVALLRLWEAELPVVAFVHDAILIDGTGEAAERAAELVLDALQSTMPGVIAVVTIKGPMARWGEGTERQVKRDE